MPSPVTPGATLFLPQLRTPLFLPPVSSPLLKCHSHASHTFAAAAASSGNVAVDPPPPSLDPRPRYRIRLPLTPPDLLLLRSRLPLTGSMRDGGRRWRRWSRHGEGHRHCRTWHGGADGCLRPPFAQTAAATGARHRRLGLRPHPPAPPAEGQGGGARECGGQSGGVAARGGRHGGGPRGGGRGGGGRAAT